MWHSKEEEGKQKGANTANGSTSKVTKIDRDGMVQRLSGAEEGIVVVVIVVVV
jgi:hypothetical protein